LFYTALHISASQLSNDYLQMSNYLPQNAHPLPNAKRLPDRKNSIPVQTQVKSDHAPSISLLQRDDPNR
ncbi:MAG TPA: hypothetical protein PLD22_06380, partial [Bacillota bacterium]|nr:hypothetical protein [Bacillota bacterium]